MYRLELNTWAGIKSMAELELNIRAGIKCTGWK
jgi:hypothetical protein